MNMNCHNCTWSKYGPVPLPVAVHTLNKELTSHEKRPEKCCFAQRQSHAFNFAWCMPASLRLGNNATRPPPPVRAHAPASPLPWPNSLPPALPSHTSVATHLPYPTAHQPPSHAPTASHQHPNAHLPPSHAPTAPQCPPASLPCPNSHPPPNTPQHPPKPSPGLWPQKQ